MTTCFSKKFGIYHNSTPLDGDKIIDDSPGIGWDYDELSDKWSECVENIQVKSEQLWVDYQYKALVCLRENDIIAIRCMKAGVPYPAEWFACDVALRAIVHATSGDSSLPLPAQPITRPPGT